MPDPFPILEVASAMRSDVEQLGSKPKFWFKHEGENWLFKEARANTGEDWAEKVASEIAVNRRNSPSNWHIPLTTRHHSAVN